MSIVYLDIGDYKGMACNGYDLGRKLEMLAVKV
jgi:hypothetical protein